MQRAEAVLHCLSELGHCWAQDPSDLHVSTSALLGSLLWQSLLSSIHHLRTSQAPVCPRASGEN